MTLAVTPPVSGWKAELTSFKLRGSLDAYSRVGEYTIPVNLIVATRADKTVQWKIGQDASTFTLPEAVITTGADTIISYTT